MFKISELPNGSSEFAKELQLLVAVKNVMDEAATTFESPNTGARRPSPLVTPSNY